MNRMFMSFLPLLAVAYAGAQTPAPANITTETSRVARFVAGPGGRPQGALLRNGTFVAFSPEIAQRLPTSLSKSALIRAVGEEYSYGGSKTIQARSVAIAGVSYNDAGLPPGGPNAVAPSGPGCGTRTVPPLPPPAPGMPPPSPSGRGDAPSLPVGVTTPQPPPPSPAGAAASGLPGTAVLSTSPSVGTSPQPPSLPPPPPSANFAPEAPTPGPLAAGPTGR